MAKNIFLDQLNNNELLSAFGAQEENAPLTPEELAQISMQAPEVVVPQVTPIVAPKIDTQKSTKSSTAPKAPAPPAKDDTDDTKTTMSKSEALIAEYQKMLGKDQQSLEDARSRDRMLKVGGSIGDALATYLNAQGQMNVKAPGVQVQQGAGLGKIADMFTTAPEIQSDVAARREALMKQYAELAKGERAQARLTSEEVRARDADLRARELAKMQIEGSLKEAGIKASGKGELTPYQELNYENKKTELLDKKTQRLQSDLKEAQDVATTIESIEEQLGFSLDDIDEVGKVKGKEVDIPGVNIPGYGRFTAYSSESRKLDDTMSKLFNVELKNRSGVSVTPPELKNLKKEFSEGKFNTEKEKLDAMKAFKQGLKKAFVNIEAGYPKQVISEYQDRGGFTSDRFNGTSESIQNSEKDKEIQDYADKFFKGDYDKASRFLKNKEGI